MQGTPAGIFVRCRFSIPKVATTPDRLIPQSSRGDRFAVDEETRPTGWHHSAASCQLAVK